MAALKESIRVLLIEDDSADAELFQEMLSAAQNPPFEVERADRLQAGLDRLTQGGIDVVLLDLSLPDAQGLQAASRLQIQAPTIPMVVLTGLNDDVVALEAVRQGAQDYLVKGRVDGNVLSRVMRYAIERKRAEENLRKAYADLKATQDELIQAEKLAALGRFSSGLAHEVKNPLAIILGAVEFLQGRLSQIDGDTKMALEKIKESTLRANTILEGLLTFARPSTPKREWANVSEMVEGTLSLLKFRTPLRNITIDSQVDESITVEVERNQIEQVLFNLLINAVEACPKGGRVAVKAYRTTAASARFSGRPACVIEVIDSGEGISPQNLPRLFEPFFTTKRDRKGVGLGLSTSKMIVENHHGELLIKSEAGRGTQAKVILPV